MVSPIHRPPVGSKVRVYWPDDNIYYFGSISEYRNDEKARVLYDDGDTEWLDLSKEIWNLRSQENNEEKPTELMSSPRVVEHSRNSNFHYSPIFELGKTPEQEISFKTPNNIGITADVLSLLWFPDCFLEQTAISSNEYARSQLSERTNLLQNDISGNELAVFFAILYYMGIVRCPDKDDYWSNTNMMPSHPIMKLMTRRRFRYIWRFIHFKRSTTENSDPLNSSDVWFQKVSFLVNHVRNLCSSLLRKPGSRLALDEMMVRFKGRSNETHRLKNKPIDEGFKFFVLADSETGFVHYFTPDGRVSGAYGRNEFKPADGSGGKIHHMVLHCVEKVLNTFIEDNQLFCIFFDNYFTAPKTIRALRDTGVGAVGTARPKRNWPPNELVVPDNCVFNDLYFCVDDYGTLCMKWVDNNVVFLISTVHDPHDSISCVRRRPRITRTNRTHVDKVWNECFSRSIAIPKVIDDYNNSMNAVDIADQRISNYMPNLRCHRTWIPMMLQCLQIIRNNAYVIYCSECPEKKLSQKQFLLNFIECLSKRSIGQSIRRSLTNSSSFEKPKKRFRMSSSHPTLPEKRKIRPMSIHCWVLRVEKRQCIYCRYLKACAEKQERSHFSVRQVRRACTYCDEHLCKDHFSLYHEE